MARGTCLPQTVRSSLADVYEGVGCGGCSFCIAHDCARASIVHSPEQCRGMHACTPHKHTCEHACMHACVHRDIFCIHTCMHQALLLLSVSMCVSMDAYPVPGCGSKCEAVCGIFVLLGEHLLIRGAPSTLASAAMVLAAGVVAKRCAALAVHL